ncbi:uncharacterized protein BDZ99DRAFT_179771 [Mytilinidion resinicola]|uniref:Uncharacterized protein n=1 Tax=Mytilinidion resinicola TaxID=574789 RepID=A0A6A6Z0A7_9PEZI|nr:uncharacterized protein BDZ99DRAFT_179771 [Mytilinidion resinicola]KAF2814521.1 hypothetical protein BDZ99DRAFT_179771 [Mytilinidion resinicola]
MKEPTIIRTRTSNDALRKMYERRYAIASFWRMPSQSSSSIRRQTECLHVLQPLTSVKLAFFSSYLNLPLHVARKLSVAPWLLLCGVSFSHALSPLCVTLITLSYMICVSQVLNFSCC